MNFSMGMPFLKHSVDHKNENIKSLQEAAKASENDIQEYKKTENTYKKLFNHQYHNDTSSTMINTGALNHIFFENNNNKKCVKQC